MESESEIAEHIVSQILQRPNTHPAKTTNEAHFYLLRAAMNVGFSEPFSPEQTAMNKILSDRCMGKENCDDAWRMYADLKSGQETL